MRYFSSLLSFLLISFLVTVSCFANDPEPEEIAPRIAAIVEPLARSNNYAGSLLVRRGDETIFASEYGYRDRAKKTKHNSKSKFFLASASAMFTSAAVMKLVDQGKVSLKDTVSKYFPGFPNGDRMTIHILLTERSGIPRIGYDRRINYSKLTESPQKLDTLIGHFRNYPLEFEPGSKYRHSRSSYILLARIIEKVSGKSFGVYLKDEIFNPLGMNDSGHFAFEDELAGIENLSVGYSQLGVTDLTVAQQLHWSSKTGHASIYSTAEDLDKFADAALSGRLLSKQSWKKMTRGYHDTPVGYGFFTRPTKDRAKFYMNGRSPGFSSYFMVFPESKVKIIMLSNIDISVPFFTVPKLEAAVFNEPYKSLNLISPPDVGEDSATKLTGKFKFGPDFYRPNGVVNITTKGGRLFADGGPLLPVDEGTENIKKFIHRRYWSTLEFETDANGIARVLKFDSYKGERSR